MGKKIQTEPENGGSQAQATDLLLAAANGDEKRVKLLLKTYDPNIQDKDKKQHFIWRPRTDTKKVVRLLFPEANLGHTGNKGKTALYLAAQGGHEEAAQWLTKQRLDPNSQDKQKNIIS
jgi:ankyrin repeat protein